MSLDQYFSSLSLSSLLFVILFFLSFDAIGSFLARRLKLPIISRSFWWVLGLSFYSFIWWIFLKHTFNPQILFVSLLIPLAIHPKSIFFRLKELFSSWKSEFLILLPLSLLSFALLIKVSLPPYIGDEIGYHYYSPAETLYPQLTQRRENMYYFLPQTLDSIYRLSFAITHNYHVARTLQLLIVLSAFVTVSKWLKKNYGKVVGNVWLLLSPFMTTNLVSMATSGHVDMATAAVVLVSICLTIDLLQEKDWDYLYGLAALWATGIGFKYSALNSLLSTSVIGVVYLIITKRLNKKKIKQILLCLPLVIVFGGFWLLRNLILKGHPFYPLNTGQKVFFEWTTPLTLQHAIPELYTGSFFLVIPLVTSLFLLLINFKQITTTTKFILLVWVFEVIIAKQMNSFIVRYFFHWPYISGIITLISLNLKTRFLWLQRFVIGMIFVLQIANTTSFVYGREFTPQIERDFFSNKININTWLATKYPNTGELAISCGNLQKPVSIYLADPDMMWFTSNAQVLGFFVNCYFRYLDLSFPPIDLSNTDENILIYSVNSCKPADSVSSLIRDDQEGRELLYYPIALKQRTLNNNLICSSKLISKNLYQISADKVRNEYLKQYASNPSQ